MTGFCAEKLYQQLTPLLKPLLKPAVSPPCWGIGGSVLLVHLGLLTQAHDLDLVCTKQSFPLLHSRLADSYEQLPVAAHPYYCSGHFSRFQTADGQVIELMADIAVMQDSGPIAWRFDPALLCCQFGLPWMNAEQWLTLYRLFERPARVSLLTDYLLAEA